MTTFRDCALVLFAIGAVLAKGTPAFGAPGATVVIESGALKGAVADGVESWKAIPYAAPPVGALRWRAPQPALKWDGVRDATAFANDCIQAVSPAAINALAKPPAEDCLYLNVWRPLNAGRKRPVLVWFHGGGYQVGGGSMPHYSGEALAKRGLVFVNLDFRLGRLGTFLHPQLVREGADGGRVGNYGYMDMIAALQWVHRNIAAFGGDPENVTIMGQSSGGSAIWTLVTSPMARGLFKKAIAMSGGDTLDTRAGGPDATAAAGVAFAQTKGIAPDDPEALAKLRRLPAEQLTEGVSIPAIVNPGPGPRTFTPPYADGKFGVDAGLAIQDGTFAHVPMIIGATSGDVGGPGGMMVAGSRKLSAAISKAGEPVYEYRFSYVAKSKGAARSQGAPHGGDVPFFLDTFGADPRDKAAPPDMAMAETISRYIVRFAETGDPNGSGLPRWPRYDRGADRLMDFTEDGHAAAKKDPQTVPVR